MTELWKDCFFDITSHLHCHDVTEGGFYMSINVPAQLFATPWRPGRAMHAMQNLEVLACESQGLWFQHDENHANCRSKGKICENYLVDHLVGAFHDEFFGLAVISAILSDQASRATAALPCRERAESFLGTKIGQHGALFDWYLIWSTLLARHSWALRFLTAEVQLLPSTNASFHLGFNAWNPGTA